MSKKEEIIETFQKKEVKNIFTRAGIEHLRLFGSFAKNHQKKGSDIDLLYQYNQKKDKSFAGVFSVYGYLENIIKRKIELVPYNGIKEELKEEIFSSMIQIF